MKIQFKINPKMLIEVEGSDEKELIMKLMTLDDVFGHDKCEACKGTNLRYSHREVDSNHYYELICKDCGAKLDFGVQKKSKALFPKRKDKVGPEGKYLANRGWIKFSKDEKYED